MKLFKKTNTLNKVRRSVYSFIVLLLMNNLMAFGTDNKSEIMKTINEEEFERIFFQDSIPFNEYDNLESQLKIFFGGDFDRPENTFYPDLSIINVSDSLREMYKYKLNDMAINENIYNDNK